MDCDFCTKPAVMAIPLTGNDPLEWPEDWTEDMRPENDSVWHACQTCYRVARNSVDHPRRLAASICRRHPEIKGAEELARKLTKQALTEVYTVLLPRLDFEGRSLIDS